MSGRLPDTDISDREVSDREVSDSDISDRVVVPKKSEIFELI